MYQRIFVPIDGSSTSNRGLDEAVKLAQLTGASIRLLHVMDTWSVATGLESYGVYVADVIPRMKEAGELLLTQAKTRLQAQGVKVDSVLLDSLTTRVSEAVIEQAKAWGADLIVIGTHGRRGVGRLLLGSDAEQIARMATVPVLLVRATEVKDSSAAAA